MIEPEVAALFEGPSSLIVGTADAHAHPEAIRAFGAQVVAADRVRVLLAADAHRTLANLAGGSAIAITATDIATNASVQVKGHAAPVEAETAADRVRHERYIGGFFGVINETDGTPYELLQRLRPGSLVALEVSVEEQFDQTPGPAAGRSLLTAGT
jgi:hypothetical protein